MRIQNVSLGRLHAGEDNAKPAEHDREGHVAREVSDDIVPLEALSLIVELDAPGIEDRPKDAVQKEHGLIRQSRQARRAEAARSLGRSSRSPGKRLPKVEIAAGRAVVRQGR